jgi:hypothetical protein
MQAELNLEEGIIWSTRDLIAAVKRSTQRRKQRRPIVRAATSIIPQTTEGATASSRPNVCNP